MYFVKIAILTLTLILISLLLSIPIFGLIFQMLFTKHKRHYEIFKNRYEFTSDHCSSSIKRTESLILVEQRFPHYIVNINSSSEENFLVEDIRTCARFRVIAISIQLAHRHAYPFTSLCRTFYSHALKPKTTSDRSSPFSTNTATARGHINQLNLQN